MTAVLASLQLQLVCHWLVPGNHSNINCTNYSPAEHSPRLPAFPNLGNENGSYNGTSANSKLEADETTASIGKRWLADHPEGYVTFPQYQAAYKIHEELATWNEARERCMAEGGYLAIADSREKIADVRSMNNQSKNWLHVGIYNSVDSNQWVRVDTGLAVTSMPWAYEDSKLSGSCAGISLFGLGLVNYLCGGKREHFVCEIPIIRDTHLRESFTEVIAVTWTPPSLATILPEGYVRFLKDRAAYKIHVERQSWTGARDVCISEGGRLAITDSMEKIKHIKSLPEFTEDSLFNVGIHKPENGDDWVGVDGSPVSSLPWAYKYPDDSGDRCSIIGGLRNGLANYECEMGRKFVCEISIYDDDNGEESTTEVVEITPTSPLVSAIRPEGYIKFTEDHFAYKFHEEDKSWSEARDICISEGARLAITDSWQKIEHIRSLRKSHIIFFFYVGIHKPENGDEWVGVDGSPVPSIQWSEGYPDETGDGCGMIVSWLRGVANIPCDRDLQFVCEIPIPDDDDGVVSATEGGSITSTSPSYSDDDNGEESTTEVVDVTSTVPSPYVAYSEDGSAYKFYKERKSWNDAKDTCVSEGARLVIIDSRDKGLHVTSFLPDDIVSDGIYVGIHKPENSDVWVRADDGLPMPSIPRLLGYPEEAGASCCVLAFNKLFNEECTRRRPFVCELGMSSDSNRE